MISRMVPVEDIFVAVKRNVADRAAASGKVPSITVEAAGAHLDKRIADGLLRPLQDMASSLSAWAAARAAPEKPAALTLRAVNKDNSVWVEVVVSNCRVDPARAATAFVKKGLMTEAQAAVLDSKAALHLLFQPDFPAGEELSPLAAALGAAKDAVAALNGSADADSRAGESLTVTLKIPLTLVIVKALLVVLEKETYAFPLNSVVEIVKVSSKEIYSVDGNDTIKLRGHALSLVDLGRIIGIKTGSGEKPAQRKIVVITDGERRLGVPVDSLIGEEEIVIKSLPEHFASVRGISGASILGDGTVTLILDPAVLIERAG
jgi:two-component system chemotaxis sensor kinase CheA